MAKSDPKKDSKDNGGNRFKAERRQYNKSDRNPDRRSGRDRRKGHDRRSGLGRRRHLDDGAVERRDVFRNQDRNECF